MCKIYLGMQMWPYEWGLSDRIYPIERTYMRTEDLLRPRQILRAVKVGISVQFYI